MLSNSVNFCHKFADLETISRQIILFISLEQSSELRQEIIWKRFVHFAKSNYPFSEK